MAQQLEYTARHRYARITARKARLVADLIRGQSVNRALELLSFSPKRASSYYSKLVRSAMANAGQDEDVNVNRLVISDCRADDGPLLNNRLRFRPGPQGRAMPIRKRTAHLTVKVFQEGGEAKKRKQAAGSAGKAAPAETAAQGAASEPAKPGAKQAKKSQAKKPAGKSKKQDS
jgi:large subunit ribosomal protein L22